MTAPVEGLQFLAQLPDDVGHGIHGCFEQLRQGDCAESLTWFDTITRTLVEAYMRPSHPSADCRKILVNAAWIISGAFEDVVKHGPALFTFTPAQRALIHKIGQRLAWLRAGQP